MTRSVGGPTRSISLKRSRSKDFSVLNHPTERDSNICLDIYEHRFLTTHQIFQLHFTSYSRARARSLGNSPGVPLSMVVVARIESKLDALIEDQTPIRERVARPEGQRLRHSTL